MEQMKNLKHLIILAIVTIIVIYISVSVFWVIKDMDTGQTIFVISSDIPQIEDISQKSLFWEKVKEFFNFPEKVPVPIDREINLKGRVVYTNGNPFAYGLVEIRTNPRQTYTDKDGYFTFENVSYGEHTITVFSKNMERLASCSLFIKYNEEIENGLLTELEDGTSLLEVKLDIKAIKIVLEIEQDAASHSSGKLLMYMKDKVPEYYPPEKDPDDQGDDWDEEPDKPDKPDKPIDTDPLKPDKPTPSLPGQQPDQPIIPPGGSGGSSGGGGSIPSPSEGDLTVYSHDDKSKSFSKRPAPIANINIFGSNKRIAPGMSGDYRFTVDNTANPFPIYYDIDFIETNNKLNIPMKYRLKNNKTNAYVTEDLKWHTIEEIVAVTANTKAPLDLASSAKTNYTLEWLWEDGGSLDNVYGEQHGGKVACTLTIKVSAQRK